ncbi:uncharacterized protein LOC133397601 isoform X2 [Phycodurus eques]|uniref:uncharacterized protein LOC133397601 isoform X2 n=1 Tax=Phycodurus eques TaxID=693459 RepID=UPI002ACDD0D2|nr:uncharacterized protein LOC133397601 isoform X2 [Phycodurus eques]
MGVFFEGMSRGESCFQCGNMKLLLNSLLLACHCTLSSRSDATDMRVNQSPGIDVLEGQTVIINCCWSGNHTRIKVKWLKNSATYKDCSHPLQSWQKDAEKCVSFELANISRENSGTYVCQVSTDIPLLKVASGNGTVVRVTDQRSNGTAEGGRTRSPLWVPLGISLASVALLLLIGLTCFYKLKQTKGVKVIYESPHLDSDVGETAKRSSGGSSQWREVVVYESVDYFEPAQMKQNGYTISTRMMVMPTYTPEMQKSLLKPSTFVTNRYKSGFQQRTATLLLLHLVRSDTR